MPPTRISAELANESGLVCKHGHHGRWSAFDKSKHCLDCRCAINLKRWYGLTPADRLAMEEKQNGRCAICERKGKLHIDHYHLTEKVRGLLCTRCNVALGFVESGLLDKAFSYLQQSKTARSQQCVAGRA